LVLLVGKDDGGRYAFCAIDQHAAVLAEVWLIHSPDAAPGAKMELRVLENQFALEAAKDLVDSIRQEAESRKMEPADLICDFTGLNKNVSAAVVLAGAGPGQRLQYVEPRAFLEDGTPDSAAGARTVEVEVHYDLTPD
jgi:hypothetical protein